MRTLITPETLKLYKSITRRMALVLFALTTSLGLSGVLQFANAATPTTLFDMGTLGGATSTGSAVSSTGQVVGWSDTSTVGVRHAFYWDSSNGIHDLTSSESDGRAFGINDSNVAVGYSQTGSNTLRAVKWDVTTPASPVMSDLTGLPSNINSQANAVNNNGVIVGYITTGTQSSPINIPFAWNSTDGYSALPTNSLNVVNAVCKANAVNNNGVIVGSCGGHAVMWDANHTLTDLGVFGGSTAEAIDINDNGDIVGNAQGSSKTIFKHNFTTGTADMSAYTLDLGASPTATGINNSGQIVGYFGTSDPKCGPFHAFVIDPTTGFSDVGTDGTVTHGAAINDNGQVTGDSNPYYCDPAGIPVASSSSRNSSSKVYAATSSTVDNKTYKRASMWEAKAGTPKISVGDATVVRSSVSGKNTTASFPVTLSRPSRATVTASYAINVGSGSATATTDFKVKTGTVTFKPNATTGLTATTLYVTTTIPGSTPRGQKTFNVTLSNPNTGTSGFEVGDATGVGTVLDSDGSAFHVYVGDSSITEGDHGKNNAKVTVSLSKPATSTLTVTLSLSDGSAVNKTDYVRFNPKTITFNAGQWQKTVAIQTKNNVHTESDKTINVALSSPSAGLTVGRANGVVTILNDD